MIEEKNQIADILVQGGVAITAGIILLAALFLPWFSTEYSAITGLTQAEDQTAVVIPLTLILLAILVIFGGGIHILGYGVGIKLATVMSAIAFCISILVIIFTLANSESFEGEILNILVGPWLGVAGTIFGAISSKLERKMTRVFPRR
jgi:hypothetical protein